MNADIVDTIGLSLGFPPNPAGEIMRDNILSTIDGMFDRGIRVVAAEGEPGCGKTVLLSQFARSHNDHAISLFINPVNRLATDPLGFRLDLANQVNWILNNEVLGFDDLRENQYVQLLMKLRRRAKSRGELYYFIVDGLTPLAQQDTQARDILFQELLHISVPEFRFLLSGSLEDVPENFRNVVPCRPLQLAPFSLPETREYLRHFGVEGEEAEELYRMCSNGFPGFLASVSRQLTDGASAQELLSQKPSGMPEFMTLEWDRVEYSGHEDELVLGVLAFSRGEFTLDELASIVSSTGEDVREFLASARIVDVVKGRPRFLTEAHRTIAREKLAEIKDEVLDKIISHLVNSEGSTGALKSLPDYYQEAGRFQEILQLLTPERLATLTVETGSLLPAHHQTELGLDAAQSLSLFEETVGMGVQRSAFRELGQADVWRSEVEARVALQDLDAALSLAQSAVLAEDKLQLLAAVAKARQDQGVQVGSDLLEQIRELAEVVSLESMGDRAIVVASDLVSVDTELAISIAESARGSQPPSPDRDLAIAMLTTSISADPEARAATIENPEKPSDSVDGPDIRTFVAALSVLMRRSSADDVLDQASQMKPKNAVLLLRAWSLHNRESDDTAKVVSKALELLVESSREFLPLTRDLRELSTPLAALEDNEQKRTLVGRFDSLKGTVGELSSTVDHVRLELHLAAAEEAYSPEAAHDRLQGLFWMIVELEDEALRAQSMARLVGYLSRSHESGEARRLYEFAQEKLEADVEDQLSSTAYHYMQLSGVIRALARDLPSMALKLARRLNTSMRRDRATALLVRSIMRMPRDHQDLSVVRDGVGQIEDEEERALALRNALATVAANSDDYSQDQLKTVIELVEQVHGLPHPLYRCECYASSLVLLEGQTAAADDLREDLLHRMRESWEAIDPAWYRVDGGFRLATTLAPVEQEVAQKYLADADSLRKAISISAEGPSTVALASIRLLTRAFSGLLPKRLESEEDLRAIENLVNSVPSSTEQVAVWADLALRCHQAERMDLGHNLVANHVRPLLEQIPQGDAYARAVAVRIAATPMFLHHVDTAVEAIRALPRSEREEAVGRTCHYLLTGGIPGDPYRESNHTSADLTYETASDVCRLLQLSADESTLSTYVMQLTHRLNKNFTGTAQQRKTIVDRIRDLITEKLPDKRNIAHDGYKVLLRAHLLLCSSSNGNDWNAVIEEAEQIPNISDQVYVLSFICSIIPEKLRRMRSQLAQSVQDQISKIPSQVERTQRSIDLAQLIGDFDQAAARAQLQRAMQETLMLDDSPETYTLQRKAIDVAHAFDSELAEKLASLLDKDPGREEARDAVRAQMNVLGTWRKMLDSPGESSEGASESIETYAHAAWMALGSLNANRMQTVHVAELEKFLSISAKGPISLSYPIHSWIIENSVRRHSRTSEMRQHLLDLFRSVLRGTQIAATMCGIHLRLYSPLPQDAEGTNSRERTATYSDGQRDLALDRIRLWLEADASEHLYVVDPYFGPNDLELLRLVTAVSPGLRVAIVTSKMHLQQVGVSSRASEAFSSAWRKLSDQRPPETRIIVATQEDSSHFPVHDRYFISRGTGLLLGTSFHSLGIGKASSIAALGANESAELEKDILQPLVTMQQHFKGNRMRYLSFDL